MGRAAARAGWWVLFEFIDDLPRCFPGEFHFTDAFDLPRHGCTVIGASLSVGGGQTCSPLRPNRGRLVRSETADAIPSESKIQRCGDQGRRHGPLSGGGYRWWGRARHGDFPPRRPDAIRKRRATVSNRKPVRGCVFGHRKNRILPLEPVGWGSFILPP